MKNYIKPELLKIIISANCDIAEGGLGQWLDDNSMGEYNDSITTYEYNS